MYFPTTHWSLLAQASLAGESAARQALEELCRSYWSPLHQYVRARGYSETEAQDLTQEFLVHLLEHSTLQRADRSRGKFRSFLLGALANFLADEYDRRHAQKRGSGAPHLSLEEAGAALATPSDLAAEAFDREWALSILENALRTVRDEFEKNGQEERFDVLRRFLPGSMEIPTYEEAAARLGLSVPALKTDLHRLRQRFKALVRQSLLSTVSAPHEIDEEMEHLRAVLMDKGSHLDPDVKPRAGFP